MGIFSRLFQRGQEGERPANEGDKPSSPAFDESAAASSAAEPTAVAAASPALATALANGGSASLAAPFWGWPRHSEPAEPVAPPVASGSPGSSEATGDEALAEGARRPVLPSVTKAESSRPADKAADQAPARTTDKASDKAPDRAPDQASARAPELKREDKGEQAASAAAPGKGAEPAKPADGAPAMSPRRQAGKGKRDDSTMVMSPPPIVPASAMRPIPAPPPGVMPAAAPAPSVLPPGEALREPAVAPAEPTPSMAAPVPAVAPPGAGLESTLASLADSAFSSESSAFSGDGAAFSGDGSVEAIDGDEISASFNRLLLDDAELGVAEPVAVAKPAAGISTAEDLAAVRDVFNDIAVVHVSQVRDVMLELRFGDADPAWLESTKPALRSLRAMAEQMELVELCGALDTFCVAVDAAVANRARISEEDKTLLLERYQALSELIPAAFELDAERDRREPIIVEALLYQIDGVEKPIIDRLFAVGLNRLDALLRVNHDDLVMMAGLRQEVAAAIVDQFRTYRATADAAVSTRDPLAERRSLGDLVIMLSILQDDFLRASDDWSAEARARKRALRKEREQTFQRIRVSLVRLGDREQLAKLERLPFNERIAALERYIANQPMARA